MDDDGILATTLGGIAQVGLHAARCARDVECISIDFDERSRNAPALISAAAAAAAALHYHIDECFAERYWISASRRDDARTCVYVLGVNARKVACSWLPAKE
jgi:hypothetical protein